MENVHISMHILHTVLQSSDVKVKKHEIPEIPFSHR